MKKFLVFLAAAAFLCSCGNENDFPIPESVVTSQGNTDDDGDKETPVNLDDDIVINEEILHGEKETVLLPSDGVMYKDFLANFLYDEDTGEWDEGSFDASTQQWKQGVKTLTITFNGDAVSYALTSKKGKPADIDLEDFSITKTDGHISIMAHTKCNYVLQGTSADGSFKLYTDKKCIVTLSGVSLTNPTGAAINIQKGNDGGKRVFLVVANDTRNYLCDGETYSKKLYPGTHEEEDEKGTVFSEGKICISGNGYLNVEAKGKNAIACDDYLYMHIGPQITMTPAPGYDGMKTKDGLYIAGGVLNITCSGNAAKGISTDGMIEVTGGRTTVISTSVPVENTDNTISQPYCVKSDSGFSMTDGVFMLSASKADGNGIYVKDVMTISGGIIKMVIAKKPLTYGTLNRYGGVIYINGNSVDL